MPRNFSGENLVAEEFCLTILSGGFNSGHYNERFQIRAMTAAGVWQTKVPGDASITRDFNKARRGAFKGL